MNETSVIEYITGAFDGVDLETSDGNSFFSYNPGRVLPEDHGFLPFATLVTNDRSDQASNLEREGTYRLNISLEKETFLELFKPPTDLAAYDFTALDRLMPHPVYGNMFWVCVLNPSDATFQNLKPLLLEAYNGAVSRYAKRAARAKS
jgi:Family of unknown function (DUF6194)